MNILKSIWAVFAGFITVVILSTVTDAILHQVGVMPEGALFDVPLLLLALLYRTIFTIVGGYITYKLAPQRPMKHVVILGIVGIIIGSIGAYFMREYGPLWYSVGIVVLGLPSVLVGGWIAQKRINRNIR